ncbi:hypothetical protein AAC387_Pa09g2152 [Persea americana]
MPTAERKSETKRLQCESGRVTEIRAPALFPPSPAFAIIRAPGDGQRARSRIRVPVQHAATVRSKKAGNGFTRKCAALVKEQRARIYILRRCATILLCWYIQGDD